LGGAGAVVIPSTENKASHGNGGCRGMFRRSDPVRRLPGKGGEGFGKSEKSIWYYASG